MILVHRMMYVHTMTHRREVLPVDVVLFWSGPFSNFTHSRISLPCPFNEENIEYATVEHRYQAMKAPNQRLHRWIASQDTAKKAKLEARKVILDIDEWEHQKIGVMHEALQAKYALPRFQKLLLATGQRRLCEDSPYDFIWGVRDGRGGLEGGDLLGKLLMQVRSEIQAQQDAQPQQLDFDTLLTQDQTKYPEESVKDSQDDIKLWNHDQLVAEVLRLRTLIDNT